LLGPVVTDRSVFDNADRFKRMMVIYSKSNDAVPGSGGVAYVNSFSNGRDDPCWVFNLGIGISGKTASHEAGHTFGLSHDGTVGGSAYYSDHSNWDPIMGDIMEKCYSLE